MIRNNKNIQSILEKYANHPDFLGIDIIDINQKGSIDDAILHIAVRKNNIKDIEVLLENGADVNLAGDLGYTPIQYACMFGNVDAVKILLMSNADPMIQNEFGQTAFDIANLSKKENKAELIENLKKRYKKKKI